MEKLIKTDRSKEAHEKQETAFKGTFISVMILGLFLIVSWVGVWALFLSR
ncbi:cytochrome c oxidase subunit 2A [Virgibacillus sp. W0430]